MPSKKGIERIKEDEGFTPKATHQTLQSGKKEKVKTIGYGYNINAQDDARKDMISVGVPEDKVDSVLEGKEEITQDQAEALFHVSVQRAYKDARRVVNDFDKLAPDVQDVLVNMSYQLGGTGLKEFRKMRRAIGDGDYQKAAKELLDSRYAQSQSSNRAKRLATQLVDYGKTVKAPPKVKAPTYQELVTQQQRELNKQRLSKVYNREVLRDRLKASMAKAPAEEEETKQEGNKDGSP